MPINRRQFLGTGVAGGALLATSRAPADGAGRIDRRALVRRHNPIVRRLDPFAALSVGNGAFAFTADVTGLQTFPEPYHEQFPLCTAAHWGWHTTPSPPGLRAEEFRDTPFDTHGRPVGYATGAEGQEALYNWLRQNPHRLHLGRIGFVLTKEDGSPSNPADVQGIRQELDLWTGLLESRFTFEGRPVSVRTGCHPDLDLLAVSVMSPLLADGRMKVRLAFPYGSPDVAMADWGAAERHRTRCTPNGRRADFARTLDDDRYNVRLEWNEGTLEAVAEHEYVLTGGPGVLLEFVCLFSARAHDGPLPEAQPAHEAATFHWERFWSDGGAVDLSGSTDGRAGELERRVVLSQFLTALHCAGTLPSAETGLLCNSWYGKFHLEMHWWHSVHFTAWGRFPLFERSLGFYERILPEALRIAARQGYRGARWPKMVGPDGRDSPSPVGPLLVWQQPHPIYYAELCYRQHPTPQTLRRWAPIVFESAEFLASFAVFDAGSGRYVLGPPLKTVSENTDPRTTTNPTFELAYWRFGLRTAQLWRERLGQPREPQWDRVLEGLTPLPERDGLYLMQEGLDDTYTRWNWEHPALLGALGMQPGGGVDVATMRRTVRRVMECWRWETSWGWDFPMAAMAAARVGEPELAVRALLLDVPKNRFHPNGHNYQRPGLTAYLPGNGGLLAAVALMAAGWTGAPEGPAPGFPSDGRWSVRAEGIRPWL